MRTTIKTVTGKDRSNSKPAMSFDPVTRSAWVRKRAWSDGRGSFSSCSLESISVSPASSTTLTNPPSTLSTPSWNAFDRLPVSYRFLSDTTSFVHYKEISFLIALQIAWSFLSVKGHDVSYLYIGIWIIMNEIIITNLYYYSYNI